MWSSVSCDERFETSFRITICPSTTVNMQHYAWQRQVGALPHFLHLWITMKVDTTHLEWILQDLSSVCLENHESNVRLRIRTRVLHSVALIVPAYLSESWLPISLHLGPLLSPYLTPSDRIFAAQWKLEKNSPRLTRRIRSLWLLQGRWETSLPPTSKQQTTGTWICF